LGEIYYARKGKKGYMRPIYESEEDLKREGGVAAIIEAQWNCKLVKLPISYHLDFAATRGAKCVAFCEVKTRNYSMDSIHQMGGYLLSLRKWTAARDICLASQVPFILVVKTLDGVYYASFATDFLPDNLLVRGRKDRDDWQDIEPCVLLKTNRFTKIA
jgi:hypothetical protein